MFHNQTTRQNHDIKVVNKFLENVGKSDLENACCCAVQNLWSFQLVSGFKYTEL
jgi:hypothetical protein